mgnify:CR=1 FL=1
MEESNTELNVCLLKVQASNRCTERGFACDFHGVNRRGEPNALPDQSLPTLEVGTQQNPIPRQHVARIRLHYLEGMDKEDAPALVCCSARMELHGSPLKRPWVKLGATCHPGDLKIVVKEDVSDWRVGDEIIVTASKSNRNQLVSGSKFKRLCRQRQTMFFDNRSQATTGNSEVG